MNNIFQFISISICSILFILFKFFHLASFCDKLLKPITTNKYTIKDSFSFANKVEELDPYLATASFDLLALMLRIFIETKHVLIVYQKVLFVFY